MRDIITQLLQQQPFHPFRIYLTGGTMHEIRQPELARVTPSTLHLGQFDHATTPPTFVDHYIISLHHVVRLEPLVADDPVVVENPQPE